MAIFMFESDTTRYKNSPYLGERAHGVSGARTPTLTNGEASLRLVVAFTVHPRVGVWGEDEDEGSY